MLFPTLRGISGYSGASATGASGYSGYSGGSGKSGYSGYSGLRPCCNTYVVTASGAGDAGFNKTFTLTKTGLDTWTDLADVGNPVPSTLTVNGSNWELALRYFNGSGVGTYIFSADRTLHVCPPGDNDGLGWENTGHSAVLPFPYITVSNCYDGATGAAGASGVSGYSGYSGKSGYSGYSGSGISGYSGYSGKSGYSGYSGKSGYSGYSGGRPCCNDYTITIFGTGFQIDGSWTLTQTSPDVWNLNTGNTHFNILNDGFWWYIIALDDVGEVGGGNQASWRAAMSTNPCPPAGAGNWIFDDSTWSNAPTLQSVTNCYSGVTGSMGQSGTSGWSGKSGYSGFSGYSGYSGYSGFSGVSGVSGYSGYSGKSGYSGISGYSGYSGVSGYSGYSGSGISGYSGYSGSGISGYSGYSGISGYSGYSGKSGYSGYSGVMAIGSTITSATAGRVLFTGAGPVLADDADLTFDGTTLIATEVQLPYMRTVNLQRTIPTVVGDEVDIGAFALTNGAGNFEVWITVPSANYSQNKRYFLPVSYHATANVWQKVLPASDTGAYANEGDVDLEINVNNATCSLRLRRTVSGAGTPGTADITIFFQGVMTDTFTPSTSTSSVAAPTVKYAFEGIVNAQMGKKVTDDGSYSYDNNSFRIVHQTPSSAVTLNDPKNVLLLSRQGTAGVAYGNGAVFNLSRYENSGANSRTRLDISLAHTTFDISSNIILTLRSEGRIFQAAPNSAPTDGDLFNGGINFWQDETNNLLKARVKSSGGTAATRIIPAVAEAEIDFGSTATWSKVFTVTDSNITTAHLIVANQSAKAATGREQDENEMDVLSVRCVPGSGSFTAYVDSINGPVVGKYKINYMYS